jgi:heterodisulfide reductase subunit C
VSCPREIKVTDIIYALKRRAIEDEVYPKKFPIPILAKEFGKMIRGKGRITETRLVMNLYLKTNIFKATKMARMGMGLMRTGRFSLKSESIKNRGQIQTIMKSLEESKEGAA